MINDPRKAQLVLDLFSLVLVLAVTAMIGWVGMSVLCSVIFGG